MERKERKFTIKNDNYVIFSR